MPKWIKIISITAIMINSLSLIWYLLGSTANFQRSLDLVSTITFFMIWIPSLALLILFITNFKKRWVQSNGNYSAFLILIFVLLVISLPLYTMVNTEGWLYDRIKSDHIKITSDEKYEYKIELINPYQSNGFERLYLKDMLTGKEMNIPVEIISRDERKYLVFFEEYDQIWVLLTPTNESGLYELSTTEMLDVSKKKFLIDIVKGTSQRLE